MFDRNIYMREWYQKNKKKICSNPHYKFLQKQWRKQHKEKVKASSRRHYLKLKTEIEQHYGSFCVCCGEKEPLFLSLDHINNDGNKNRKSGTVNYYIQVRKEGFPKDKYQVLCMNCNHGKSRNNGICPHTSEGK